MQGLDIMLQPKHGSHLPVLMRAMAVTEGDVVECGCGYFSTTFLHWASYDAGRRMRSYEGDKDWADRFAKFNRKHHTIEYVTDWDSVDLSLPVGLALIDHAPGHRRWKEAQRLLHATLVVLHDAGGRDGRAQGYEKLAGLFKYQWMYRDASPMTAVVSNIVDCTKLMT